MSSAYFETGEYPGYLSEMKKEGLLTHDASLSAIEKAAEKGFAAHGPRGLFKSQLDRQNKAFSQGKLSPYYLAETYSLLGNTEDALKYLKVCYDRHADETTSIAVDPAFNNLQPLPAFRQLLAKVGLPPAN